jgi:hypothetical protein
MSNFCIFDSTLAQKLQTSVYQEEDGLYLAPASLIVQLEHGN